MSITKRTKGSKFEYRFVTRYETPEGVKQKASKWYATKGEAQRAEAEFKRSLKTIGIEGTTFKEVYEDWLQERETSGAHSHKTVLERHGIIQRYFAEWDNLDITKITPLIIRKRLQRPDMSTSAVTRNKYRTILHGIFKHAMRYYGLQTNPVDSVAPFVNTETFKEKTIFTPEQFMRFLEYMDPEYEPLFQFIYWLGLRRGEALSLTFGDVKNGVLRIWRQYDVSTQTWTTLKTSSSARYIRLPSALLRIYNELHDYYSAFAGFNEDWFIFGGYHPLTRTGMDIRRKAALEAAGLPYITNHELRHSYVSNMLKVEENQWLVSRSVGHSNIDMTTSTYAHLAVTDLSEEIDKLIASVSPDIKA